MSKLDKTLPSIRCSQKELDELNRKVQNTTLTKSDFIRNAIFFTEVKEVNKSFQKKQLFLLNNIANNINQIARYTNTKKRIDKNVLSNLDEILNHIHILFEKRELR
jgi:excinuclease UvrABC nuclease subunit